MRGLIGLLAFAAVAAGSAVAAYVVTKKKAEKKQDRNNEVVIVENFEDILDDSGASVEPISQNQQTSSVYPEPDAPAADLPNDTTSN